MSSSIFLT